MSNRTSANAIQFYLDDDDKEKLNDLIEWDTRNQSDTFRFLIRQEWARRRLIQRPTPQFHGQGTA